MYAESKRWKVEPIDVNETELGGIKDATIIEVSGRVDSATAPALDKTVNEDIADTENLILDLENVEYISSAGLRVILGAQKKMQKLGSMKVINVCEAVMDVFEMTGFAEILTIE